ncbi:MAG TPA: hypothetical protein VHB99_04020 [Pirellulales bacterium]|nr:hypothetical protein [Pirellulales bacterium]
MRRRFQYTLKTLLAAMLIVAVFFGGMATQRWLDKRKTQKGAPVDIVVGVHGRDLEDAISDFAEQLKQAPGDQQR